MMSRKKEVIAANYLDYIPVHSDIHDYNINESGRVTVLRCNTGILNKITQLIFHQPEVSYIHLDDIGNFIWPLIDGNRSIYDIARMVHEQFGDRAEPLYNRLIQYLHTLSDYGFITIQKVKKD